MSRIEGMVMLSLEDVLWMRSIAEARVRSLLRSPLVDVSSRRKKAGGEDLWTDRACDRRLEVALLNATHPFLGVVAQQLLHRRPRSLGFRI